MIFDQRNHSLVIGSVGVVEIGFIHQNRRFAWSFVDELAQFVLGRDAGSGIVWVADVNQTFISRREHFWKVVTESGGEGNFHHVSAVDARLIENCFESWISGNEFATLFPSKRVGAKFQNLVGPVAEQDLIAINAIDFRQLIDQHIVVLIRVTRGQTEGVTHCFQRLRRRPVWIFIGAQANNLRCSGMLRRARKRKPGPDNSRCRSGT